MAKKGLGKGLGALLGDGGAEDVIAPAITKEDGDTVTMLKLVDIEPNRNQPRKSFDDEKLMELETEKNELTAQLDEKYVQWEELAEMI